MFPGKINKIFVKISEEVKEKFDTDIEYKEVEYLIKAVFRHLLKLMKTVTKFEDSIKSIKIPELGTFKFNPKPLICNINKGMENTKIGVEEGRSVYRKLASYGWFFFRWTYSSGYIFVNEISNEFECMPTTKARTVRHAMSLFLDELIEKGTGTYKWVLKPEFKPAIIFTASGILQYDKKGNYIKKYETLIDVVSEHWVNTYELFSILMHNNKARILKTVGEAVFFIDDGNISNRKIRLRGIKATHNYDVSILNKETSEVLFYRLGNPNEAARFIRYKGISKSAKSSLIIKALKSKSKLMYGYKWRKEPEQEDKRKNIDV